MRSTPDVSFEADPSTGVAVSFVPPGGTPGIGNWGIVGGTSVGAPAWAGIVAIADQGRALASQPALTGGTQTVPDLYALPATDFRKVALSSESTSEQRIQPSTPLVTIRKRVLAHRSGRR